MSETPVRVEAAAQLLGVSEETVRECVAAGLMFATDEEPHLLLDPARLREVAQLAEDMRAAGEMYGELLDIIWHRLADEPWLGDADFVEGLAQMARGEYSTLYLDGRAAS